MDAAFTAGGRLLNRGTVNFGSSLTFGDGIENDTAMTMAAGQTVTLYGAGLDNEGTFTLAGGTLTLTNITSNGSFVFDSGTLSITGAGGTNVASIVSNSPNTTININADNVSIGNAASFTGFNHQGVLNVGANTVMLNSAGLRGWAFLPRWAAARSMRPTALPWPRVPTLSEMGL